MKIIASWIAIGFALSLLPSCVVVPPPKPKPKPKPKVVRVVQTDRPEDFRAVEPSN